MNELYRTNARYDPTKTIVLRRQYEAETTRRFRALRNIVMDFVKDQDALGLRTNAPRFEFVNSPNKVAPFIKWLRSQSDFVILDGVNIGNASQRSWQNVYISSAYQRGISSAAGNLRGAGAEVRDEYISSAFFQPVHAERAGLIYTRAFSDLEGITSTMSTRMGRSLARGIIEGRGVNAIARQLADDVTSIGLTRARVIARTEVINAHAEASLTTYEQAGVEGVNVLSEFATAGDSAVCPRCEQLEGRTFTVAEARGIIPVHPNCRCAWLPVITDAKGMRLG